MVRATRARRHEVTLFPLRTVLASLRKKLLGFVDQREAELLKEPIGQLVVAGR
jgi:hypothetical protein